MCLDGHTHESVWIEVGSISFVVTLEGTCWELLIKVCALGWTWCDSQGHYSVTVRKASFLGSGSGNGFYG